MEISDQQPAEAAGKSGTKGGKKGKLTAGSTKLGGSKQRAQGRLTINKNAPIRENTRETMDKDIATSEEDSFDSEKDFLARMANGGERKYEKGC